MTEPVAALMTLAEAQQWVTEAVATQPEGFVYCLNPSVPDSAVGMTMEEEEALDELTRCYYLPQRQLPESDPRSRTGCLVGTAMVLAGRLVEARHENNAVTQHMERWDLSVEAAGYLTEVQSLQDNGQSWETAAREGMTRHLMRDGGE